MVEQQAPQEGTATWALNMAQARCRSCRDPPRVGPWYQQEASLTWDGGARSRRPQVHILSYRTSLAYMVSTQLTFNTHTLKAYILWTAADPGETTMDETLDLTSGCLGDSSGSLLAAPRELLGVALERTELSSFISQISPGEVPRALWMLESREINNLTFWNGDICKEKDKYIKSKL